MLGAVSNDDEALCRAGPADGPDYEVLHATVANAIRLVPLGQPLDAAAHEALARLRASGVALPPRPPSDPLTGELPPFAPELAEAPRHPDEPP